MKFLIDLFSCKSLIHYNHLWLWHVSSLSPSWIENITWHSCTTLFIRKYCFFYIQGVPRRMCQISGGCSLWKNYTDLTQNTYVQSWTVTEIMAREKCGLLAGPRTVPVSWRSYPYPSLSVVSCYGNSAHARSKLLKYFLLDYKVLHVSAWHSCHVYCLEP